MVVKMVVRPIAKLSEQACSGRGCASLEVAGREAPTKLDGIAVELHRDRRDLGNPSKSYGRCGDQHPGTAARARRPRARPHTHPAWRDGPGCAGPDCNASGGRALIGDFPKGFWPYLLIAALSLRRVRRSEAPQMIFVVRNGHGNHMRRRRLWPLHLGGVVIVRCELCNIVRRQRWTRWEQMSEPLNAPASGNWRSTNYRH
jgi:hypothetical protein